MIVPQVTSVITSKSLGLWANMFRMLSMADVGSPQISHRANSAAPSTFHAIPKHQIGLLL